MITTEIVTIANKQFIHSYSDAGKYIYGGMPASEYRDALDPVDCPRDYTETDHIIEHE